LLDIITVEFATEYLAVF